MNKLRKKIIVNTFTLVRVAGTILLPILYNYLSASIFILIVGLILLTDSIDGILARRWKVSTIFGSLLDIFSDKIFGIAILIVISSKFPMMIIAIILELLITITNVTGTMSGSDGKASYIGRVKTWIIGISMFLLLLVGLLPELYTLENKYENTKKIIVSDTLNFIDENKVLITSMAATSTIVSQTVVLGDYLLKTKNQIQKSERKYKVPDLIKNKEYIKSIIFDENYYEKTKDILLMKKLMLNIEKKLDN